MRVSFSAKEFQSLSRSTQAEILQMISGAFQEEPVEPLDPSLYKGIDMEGVVDLNLKQVREWMLAASDKTRIGVRLFAEQPIVTAQQLIDAGVENISHFQSRTTTRTRTVTGNKNAYLLGWDDWQQVEDNQGRYAVTPTTHRSLRAYFDLD